MMKMRVPMKPMKKTNSHSHPYRLVRNLTFLLALVTASTAALAARQFTTGASVQNDTRRGPIQRVVDGKVTNKADAFIAGAVVYLKDSKSLAVKTYITDDAGLFHFGQLSQNTDYELWAESNGIRSKSKSISSFDDKNSYNFVLKIDAAK
jgi:hypothetical protein